MTELLAVVNQKGGVGKTTSCINICASLAKTKRKTLLVDFDPQSNATRGCGIDPHGLTISVNDLLFVLFSRQKPILTLLIEAILKDGLPRWEYQRWQF